MKNLKESYSTGYPTSIGNSQSQEYQGALGPIDAETVQGKDRLNAKTSEGLHRINVFISQFFKRTSLNPQNDIAQLRVRLNHLRLDFPFTNLQPVEAVNNFVVTEGGQDTFGVTLTTDLSKGFDRGDDLPKYNLEIRVIKVDGGFKLEGKMTPRNPVAEEFIEKSKRSNRINGFKDIWNEISEDSKPRTERTRVKGATDITGAKEEETRNYAERTKRSLTRKRR